MQTHKQWCALSSERAMRYISVMLNLRCCKCARMRFHCANDLVVLRSCAPWREHWSLAHHRALGAVKTRYLRPNCSIVLSRVLSQLGDMYSCRCQCWGLNTKPWNRAVHPSRSIRRVGYDRERSHSIFVKRLCGNVKFPVAGKRTVFSIPDFCGRGKD